MPNSRLLSAILAASSFIVGAPAFAQIQRVTFVGDGPDHQMGRSFGGGRDLTLDGKPDFIVGARGVAGSATFAGRAYLFSGNGAFIRTFSGATAGDEFGVSVALVDDVNGDGTDDILIGARGFDGTAGVNSGRAYLYRGETSSHTNDYQLIATFDGPDAGANFGHSVADIGDVDGDGFGDFAIGASYINAAAPGKVFVYSGVTMLPLATLTSGGAVADSFGYWVCKAGDVDGDGFGDLAVSATTEATPPVGTAGMVRIFRGATPGNVANFSLFRAYPGEQHQQHFGISMSGAQDQNNDGVPDLLIGSNLFDGPGEPAYDNRGKAYVYSGADGSLLWSRVGSEYKDWFGIGVAMAGNLDGHGGSEFLVGACQTEKGGKGHVYGYSGTGDDPLFDIIGELGSGAAGQGDAFGFSVGNLLDMDGDGANEFFGGSYGYDGFGGVNAGKGYVFSSAVRCLHVDLPPPHVLKSYSQGWPRLGNTIFLRIEGAPAFSFGVFALSPELNAQPFFGGTLFLDLVAILPIPVFADAFGKFEYPIPLPTDSLFLGLTIHVQAGFLDASQVLGVAHSNLLTLTTFL